MKFLWQIMVVLLSINVIRSAIGDQWYGPTGEGSKGPVANQYRANGEAAQLNAKSLRLSAQANQNAAELNDLNAQQAYQRDDLISAGLNQAAAQMAKKLANSYNRQAEVEEEAADAAFKNAAVAAGQARI